MKSIISTGSRSSLIVCAFLLTLASFAAPATAENPALDFTVGTPPKGEVDFAAFVAIYLGEAYHRLGLHLVVQSLPWAKSIDLANQGTIDGELFRTEAIARGYPNLIQVPTPVFSIEYRTLTLGKRIGGKGWESLAGIHPCTVSGKGYSTLHLQAIDHEMAPSLREAVAMMRAGKCGGIVINQMAWLTIGDQDLGTFCESDQPLDRVDLFHYVNRRHASIVPQLADELRALKADGTFYRAIAPINTKIAANRATHMACH